MSVPFKELQGSPVESIGRSGASAKRTIIIASENRAEMISELLGATTQFSGLATAQYPRYENLGAVQIQIQPFDDKPDGGPFTNIKEDLPSHTGQYLQLDIDYELARGEEGDGFPIDEEDIPTGTYVTYRQDFGGDYLTIPPFGLEWENSADPVPPDANRTIRVPLLGHHVTWHRVLDYPRAAMRNSIGTLNNATFMGIPAEELLFDGATVEKEYTTLDAQNYATFGYKVEYTFKEKTIKHGTSRYGWNHTYRSVGDAQGFDRLVTTGPNPRYLYESSNLMTLFQFQVIPAS